MSCVTLQFCFTPWSFSSIRRWPSVDRNVWLCIPARAYIRQEAGVNNDVHVCYLCGNMATVVVHKAYCLAKQREAPDETVWGNTLDRSSQTKRAAIMLSFRAMRWWWWQHYCWDLQGFHRKLVSKGCKHNFCPPLKTFLNLVFQISWC